jgi:hypothetical protein
MRAAGVLASRNKRQIVQSHNLDHKAQVKGIINEKQGEKKHGTVENQTSSPKEER